MSDDCKTISGYFQMHNSLTVPTKLLKVDVKYLKITEQATRNPFRHGDVRGNVSRGPYEAAETRKIKRKDRGLRFFVSVSAKRQSFEGKEASWWPLSGSVSFGRRSNWQTKEALSTATKISPCAVFGWLTWHLEISTYNFMPSLWTLWAHLDRTLDRLMQCPSSLVSSRKRRHLQMKHSGIS